VDHAPSVLEILQSSTGWLEKQGVESARLNAEHLLAHVLGKKRLELYLEFDRPLFEKDLAPMRELIRRRARGEPLQHLLGTVEFLGHTFRCDRRALVPRPETERMVELVIEELREDPPARILDVGVGSGVIVGSLAAAFPSATLAGCDRSEEALALAAENLAALGYSERVALVQSDLFEAIAGKFDLIISNPPYIPAESIETLAIEVREYDPREALDGGPDGVELPTRLLAEARDYLAPGAFFAMEIGDGQSPLLLSRLSEHGYHSVRAVEDYQGVPRFLFARYG